MAYGLSLMIIDNVSLRKFHSKQIDDQIYTKNRDIYISDLKNNKVRSKISVFRSFNIHHLYFL